LISIIILKGIYTETIITTAIRLMINAIRNPFISKVYSLVMNGNVIDTTSVIIVSKWPRTSLLGFDVKNIL